jgi:CheY-like chemotaxis protein
MHTLFWIYQENSASLDMRGETVSTILVVDDEPLVLNMVAMMLEEDGHSVLTAGSGAEAIDLWRSRRGAIDLLVSDVRMPVMDGCTLANGLQQENPNLPVLLISGYCEHEPMGCNGQFPLLPKPFSMPSLLLAVHTLLEQPLRSATAYDEVRLISSGAGR